MLILYNYVLESFCSVFNKRKQRLHIKRCTLCSFTFKFITYVLVNRTRSQSYVHLVFISFTVKYASLNVIWLSFIPLPPTVSMTSELNKKEKKKNQNICPPPSALKCSNQLHLLPHESQMDSNLRHITIVGGQVIFFSLVGQKRHARLDNGHFRESPAGEPRKVTPVQIFKLAGFDSFSRLERSPPSQQKALLRYGS